MIGAQNALQIVGTDAGGSVVPYVGVRRVTSMSGHEYWVAQAAAGNIADQSVLMDFDGTTVVKLLIAASIIANRTNMIFAGIVSRNGVLYAAMQSTDPGLGSVDSFGHKAVANLVMPANHTGPSSSQNASWWVTINVAIEPVGTGLGGTCGVSVMATAFYDDPAFLIPDRLSGNLSLGGANTYVAYVAGSFQIKCKCIQSGFGFLGGSGAQGVYIKPTDLVVSLNVSSSFTWLGLVPGQAGFATNLSVDQNGSDYPAQPVPHFGPTTTWTHLLAINPDGTYSILAALSNEVGQDLAVHPTQDVLYWIDRVGASAPYTNKIRILGLDAGGNTYVGASGIGDFVTFPTAVYDAGTPGGLVGLTVTPAGHVWVVGWRAAGQPCMWHFVPAVNGAGLRYGTLAEVIDITLDASSDFAGITAIGEDVYVSSKAA